MTDIGLAHVLAKFCLSHLNHFQVIVSWNVPTDFHRGHPEDPLAALPEEVLENSALSADEDRPDVEILSTKGVSTLIINHNRQCKMHKWGGFGVIFC